ncbi:FHA domain-containing protein [Oscillospiraceae bacterium HV4-5-C5C]|nr:FHA domain-containing protein [Oscillospiraceae bacterium HV4-5-C5C]
MLGKDLLTYWQLETNPQMPGQIIRRSPHKEKLAANYQYQIMQLQQHKLSWPLLPVSRLTLPTDDLLIWPLAEFTPFTDKYSGRLCPADLRLCLTQISSTMLRLEEFLLWPNRLLLALDNIYVRSDQTAASPEPVNKLFFLYVPASQSDSPIEPNEQELLWRFIQDCLSKPEWAALLTDQETLSLQQAAAQGASGLSKLLQQADFLSGRTAKVFRRGNKASLRPKHSVKQQAQDKANASRRRGKPLLQPFSFPLLMLEELTLLLLANLCFSIFLKENDWLFLLLAAGGLALLLFYNIYLLVSPQSPYRKQASQFEKIQAQNERRAYGVGKQSYRQKRHKPAADKDKYPVAAAGNPDELKEEAVPSAELYDLEGRSAAAYKQLFRDIAFRAHEVYPLAVLVSQKTFLGHSRRHCNIRLTDSSIDAVHARIDYIKGQYQITDLDSAQGTFVNGIRLSPDSPYPLNGDETITLGQKNLFFRLDRS